MKTIEAIKKMIPTMVSIAIGSAYAAKAIYYVVLIVKSLNN